MIKLNKIHTPSATHEEALQKIYASMRPVYAACKLFGLNALQIPKSGQRNSNVQYLYLAFYLTLYTLLGGYSLSGILRDEGIFVVTNRYIFFAECSVMILLMLVSVVFTFVFRKVQLKAFDLLAHIDVSFHKNGFRLEYGNLLRTNYVILVVVIISLVLRSIFLALTVQVDVFQKLVLFLSATIKAFSKYQFVVFVLQLQVRFAEINSIIRSYFSQDSKIGRLVLNPAVKAIPQNLYVLCRLHYKLSSVKQKINSAFAVQLLVSIAVSLFDVLFQSYYLYYVATGKTEVFNVLMILSPLVWLVDETIEIYWLVYACASTCDQANETPTNLHELRNNHFDMEMESHIQTYSLQMLHQRVQFSVLGFFVVDYTLIYSIVGAVTTYLVIFIQFDQSSSGQNPLEDAEMMNSTTSCG